MGLSQSHRNYAVGYGLAANKAATIIKPSLVAHAKAHGIDLIQIDTTKPLIEQGPFDCVIHKLYDDDWKKQLADFSSKNPTVPVIDQPEAIERLHNRVTMLEAVAALKKSSPTEETVGVPKQIVVENLESLSDPDLGLIFPVVAKPLLANGTVKSHNMSLVFNAKGLVGLNTPVVLQEFVSHGGVVFKVYVAGEIVKCVTRESLPDVSEEEGAALGDSLLFSQISNLKSQEDKQGEEAEEKRIEMPPVEFVKDVADGLRKALKLNLFNFDMIRDSRDRKRYFVIDINYFPGYAKIPEYETMVTDFLLGVVVPGKGSDGAED